MKKTFRSGIILFLISALLFTGTVLFTGCSGEQNNNTGSQTESNSSNFPDETDSAKAEEEAELAAASVTFTQKDLDTTYDTANAGYILFDSQITVSEGAVLEGDTVTVTKSGTYVVSGHREEGQLLIALKERESVHLIFSDLQLSCSFGVPVYIKSASKVIITLEEGTVNILTDHSPAAVQQSAAESGETGSADAEEQPYAAVYSKEDLTINGSGTMTVQSDFQSGIVSKDTLKLLGGTIIVETADHGLKGKDCVAVRDAQIQITAGGDGMKATNSTDSPLGFVLIESGHIRIDAGGDGIQAEGALIVKGGDLDITAGGGAEAKAQQGTGRDFKDNLGSNAAGSVSQKGLKAGSCLLIQSGDIRVNSCDDAIHTNGTASVKDGVLSLMSGDDGIHADQVLSISGGEILISQSYEGLEAAVIDIRDGKIELCSEDDGINAASGSTVSGFAPDASAGRPSDFSSMVQDMTPESGVPAMPGNPEPPAQSGIGFPGGGWNADKNGFPGNQGNGGMGSGSNGAVYISGGYCYIDAGGDGLDSNGLIEMTGGTVLISGPENSGNSAIDYDGSFVMNGGVLIAAGSSGMAQQPGSASAAYSVMASFAAQAAGTIVSLRASDGSDIATFAPSKTFGNLVVCTPALQKGASYVLYAGGTCTGQEENGLYSGGEYSGGTELCSFTVQETCTVCGSGGFGGFSDGGHGKVPGGRR